MRPGDVVLDLGCGSGIFSFVAARRGCRKVYAVDGSPIIEEARAAARRNGLDGRIEFIRTRFEDLELPERADLIVHELIGSRFWDEDLLRIVVQARERHLERRGRLLPWRIDVLVVPTSLVSDLERSLAFWQRRRYGFDLGNFGRLAFRQAVGDVLSPANVDLRSSSSFLARPKTILRLDLRRAQSLPAKIGTSFRLKRGQRLTGLCAFLRVHLDAKRSFATAPRRTGNHWGQVFLPTFEPKVIERDAQLDVTLSMAADAKDWRWTLDVSPWRVPAPAGISPARARCHP